MKKKILRHKRHQTGGGPPPKKFTPIELEFIRILGDTPIFQGLFGDCETPIEVVKSWGVTEKDAKICNTTLKASASVLTKVMNTSKSCHSFVTLFQLLPLYK